HSSDGGMKKRKTRVIAMLLGMACCPAAVLAAPLQDDTGSATNPAIDPVGTDYPASARREGRGGIAYVRLSATAGGTIKTCRLARSSGQADLDAAACRVALRQAKIPVLPDDGKLHDYLQPVQWTMVDPPDDTPPDPEEPPALQKD